MNSSKLTDIFENGSIVIPLFFLKNYKKWDIELDDFLFLMYLYHFGNNFSFDPKKFSDDLNLNLTTIMQKIDFLTEKGFVQVEVLMGDKNLKEEVILLDGFYQKVSLLMMDEVVGDKKDDSNVFSLIEKEFGRTLSPLEYEIIKAWLDSNISEELIREAVREATYNGVANLRYIDKILYEWKKMNIETIQDVQNMRNKKKKKEEQEEKEEDSDVDMNIVDWNWFDEEE